MADALTLDDDAVLWSHPESERGDRPLLLLLHGKGSHEGDLVSLSDRFPSGFAIASLRAPVADGPGFSWFRMTTPGSPDVATVDAAVDALFACVDALPFSPSGLGLLGFSQGGVIALQALRREPERVGFALNLSGFVAPGDERGDDAIARHPVFWGRGDADVAIPASAIARTEEWLPEHVDLTARVYDGLGHSVSMAELSDIEEFLAARL
jgi:phospholipase/carboxylesterase